jgi:alkylated DNA repair dioxygenase AlkB
VYGEWRRRLPTLLPIDVREDKEIPGLKIASSFVSEDEEKELIARIDCSEWRDDLARRVQHYGYVYDYAARSVDASSYVGPLPEWVNAIAARLCETKLLDEPPDQVIVNEYVSNQGIAKHIDCVPCFQGRIVTLSLLETWEMFFWPPVEEPEKVIRPLERRSAFSLGGESRLKWRHEIPKRKNEPWGARSRRLSLTFRKIRLR